MLLSPFVDAVILLLWFSPVGWASLHTMQLCLSWTGERAELRITSVELLTEYHLAGVLAYSEVVSGRVEVVQLQGGSVVQRNVICPVSALLPKRAEEGFHFTQHVSLV